MGWGFPGIGKGFSTGWFKTSDCMQLLPVLYRPLSISYHFGNFVFGCFWRQSYQNIKQWFVSFLFRLAHLALQTENIVEKIMQPKR